MKLKQHYLFFLFFLLCLTQVMPYQQCTAAEFNAKLKRTLQLIPEWEECQTNAKIEAQEEGLTNHNYKVTFPLKTYFIRMKDPSSKALGVDFLREVYCTYQAAALGIAPEILFSSFEDQTLVLPFIDSKPIEKNLNTFSKIIPLLRHFHQSKIFLENIFCPYEVIEDYYKHVKALHSDYDILVEAKLLFIIEEIKKFAPGYRFLVPCHLDLYYKNFLDDGTRMWIIDWEYSAMADPLVDLASCASSNFMSSQEMQELLQEYLETFSPQDFAYFYLMTILTDIRWGLWSLIQAEISSIRAPYKEFAKSIFESVMKRVEDQEYEKSLIALRKF